MGGSRKGNDSVFEPGEIPTRKREEKNIEK